MKPIVAAVAAALTLALAGGCASDRRAEEKRSAGEYSSDAALTARVKSAIATNVGARTAASINIETYRGTVQLSGFAASREQAELAEAAAKKVQGVRDVKNDVRVKSSS